MARPREPIALIQAKGKKNLTKAEIEERTAKEPKICIEGIKAPNYLTAVQKKRFNLLADQLQRINIMGETDVDTLARYVTAQSIYEQLTKELRDLLKKAPDSSADDYYERLDAWMAAQEGLTRQQDRYFKQAHACAMALGLTISSRCKLEVPIAPELPKENKFAKFGKAAQDE